MTYLYSGQTWYQKNFGAIMVPNEIGRFNNLIESFNARKKQYTCDAFKEIFIKGTLPLPEEEMQQLYEAAASWHDFFKPLKEAIDIAAFCNFISPWLSSFVKDILRHDFMNIPYMFILNSLRPVTYKIMAFSGGMRQKFTKKQLRRAPLNEM
jgi:hypothetical protein